MAKEYRFGFSIVGDSEKGTKALQRVREEITGVEGAQKKAKQSSDQWKGSSDNLDGSLNKVGKTLKYIAGLAGVSLGVRELAKYADQWSDLNSRLVNAVGSQEAADEAMKGISQTARSTYSSLQATADAFLRNNTTLKELGYTTKSQLDLSDALNNSLVISGTKGQQAESVMAALSKAFASGSLRGQNFNTVIENGGRTVEALAAGLGVGTIELRAMAEAGELTTGRVINALTSQMELLREEAGRMPATIGDGFTLLDNSMMELVGSMDSVLGVSEKISSVTIAAADRIKALAGNSEELRTTLDRLGTTALVLLGTFGLYKTSLAAIALQQRFLASETVAYQIALAQKAGATTAAATAQAALTTSTLALRAALLPLVGPAGIMALVAGGVYLLIEGKKKLIEENVRLAASYDPVLAKLGSMTEIELVKHAVKVNETIGNLKLLKMNWEDTFTPSAAKEVEKLTKEIAIHEGHLKLVTTRLRGLQDGTQALIPVIAEAAEVMSELSDEEIKARAKAEELIFSLASQKSQLSMTGREQAIFNNLLKAGSDITQEQRDRIVEMTGSLYDHEQGLRAAAEAAKEREKAEVEAAREIERATKESMREIEQANKEAAEAANRQWQRTHEAITGYIIDFADNGGSAFKRLGDVAVATLKRIVAEWAAADFMSFFGMGKSGSSLAGGGGGGAGVGSALLAGGKGLMASGSQFLGGLTGGAIGTNSMVATGASSLGAGTAALMTNPVTWAVLAAAGLYKAFGHKETPSWNAGFLTDPNTPLGKSGQSFQVDAFASGFAPTGFYRRSDQGEAEQVIDLFRTVDTAIVTLAEQLGAKVSAAGLKGFSETLLSGTSGTVFGAGGEKGKPGVAIETQLGMFAKHLVESLRGQVSDSELNSILEAGGVEQMITKLAEIVHLQQEVTDAMLAQHEAELAAVELQRSLVDRYMGAEERLLTAQAQIESVFNSLSLAVPETSEDLLALIRTLDPLSESGRNAMYAISSLQDAFRLVQDASQRAAQAQVELVQAVEQVADVIENRVSISGAERTQIRAAEAARAQERYGSALGNVTRYLDLIGQQQQQYAQREQDLLRRRFDLFKSLQAYTTSLRLGDKTTLSPAEQLALARSQFESASGTALNTSLGMEERMAAAEQLQGTADAYLASARSYFASGGEYKDIFDSVLQDLEAAKFLGTNKDPSIVELQSLNDAVAGLPTGIAEALAPLMAQLISAGQAPKSTSFPGFNYASSGSLYTNEQLANMISSLGPDAIAAAGSFNVARHATTDEYIQDLFQSRTSQDMEKGLRSFAAVMTGKSLTGSRVAQALGLTDQQFEVMLAQYGIPAFASGGMHKGGLMLTGEQGPELVATGQARIWNNRDMSSMLATGSPETSAKLDRLNANIEKLISIEMAKGDFDGRKMDEQTNVLKDVSSKLSASSGVGSSRFKNVKRA